MGGGGDILKSSPVQTFLDVTTFGMNTAYRRASKSIASDKKEARDIANAQKDAAIQQQRDIEKKRKDEQFKTGNVVRSRYLASQVNANRSSSRGGTILTSPLGLPGAGGSGGKTLLGQ